MRLRRSIAVWAIAVALISSLVAAVPIAAASPNAVQADGVTLKVEAPPTAAVGDTVTIRVTASDGTGRPVAGAPIILFRRANFLSTIGEEVLGRASTDGAGVATFSYIPTTQGQQSVIVRLMGNGSRSVAETSVDLNVDVSTQLYQQQAAVSVPGVGIWILVLILGAFWSVYFVVVVLINLIAREGEKYEVYGGRHG